MSQVITNLKHASAGHDGIDAKILNIIKYHVIKPITHICNLSINNGIIPREMKSNRLLLNADKTNLMVFSPNIMKYDNNYVNVFIDGVKV